MWEYVVEVKGMMCGMCEAHLNDVIRRTFTVKKVTSSHSKGRTVIITAEDLDEERLRECIAAQGYEMGSVQKNPWKRWGFGR